MRRAERELAEAKAELAALKSRPSYKLDEGLQAIKATMDGLTNGRK
jgi:hypothetical protein